MTSKIPAPSIDIELAIFTFFEGQFCVVLEDAGDFSQRVQKETPALSLPMKRWRDEPNIAHCLAFLADHPSIHRDMEPVFVAYSEPSDRRSVVLRFYLCAEVNPSSLPRGFQLYPARINTMGKFLDEAISRLQSDLENRPLVPWMLGGKFTLSQVQEASEIVLGRLLDKRHFRRHLQETGWLRDTWKKTEGGAHRPATLYMVNHAEVLKQSGHR